LVAEWIVARQVQLTASRRGRTEVSPLQEPEKQEMEEWRYKIAGAKAKRNGMELQFDYADQGLVW